MTTRQETTDVLHVLDTIGVTLMAVRVLRGASQREVARQTGLSLSVVSRVEKGEDCTVSSARALLAWIGGTP